MNVPLPKRTPIEIIAATLLLLAAMAVAVGLPVPTPEGTTRALTITTDTANPTVPFQKFDGNPPKLFDINGDGQMELIAQNDNQWIYVFDSKEGRLLFEAKTTFPPNWGARSFNGPEVAIMHQGGTVSLIVANSAAFITSYRFEPAASDASKFSFTKVWERRADDCYPGAGMDAKPVLADLDKDGRFEILAATEQQGLYALRDDGTLYWKNCLGGGNAEPTVADVNLDGWPDVVHVSDGGRIALLKGRTGGWMWNYNILSHFSLRSGSMPVGAAVGQLDGIGGLDIAVGVRDSHDSVDYTQNHAMLLALDSGGNLLWARQDPVGNPLTYTHAIIGDADKDGENEVYWADWNTMGHKPGNWERIGPGNFYRYDRVGNLVWKQTLNTFWSNDDIPIADVTGDGVQDMLANGPASNGHDGIWYLNTRTGAKQEFVDAWPYKVSRAPVVADLWNTGTTQWIVQVNPYGPNSSYGIQVYDTGVPFDALWPHLPNPKLGPAAPQPPPPPTDAPGFKEAESFATKPAGGRQTSSLASAGAFWNQWSNGYIEDHLQGDGSSDLVVVARGTPANGVWPTMVVTVDGGSARTFNVSSSSFAEYRSAAPSAGVHKISVGFTNDFRTSTEDRNLHIDLARVVPVAGNPPPTGGVFAATFTPKAVGNDWWIATTVSASETVTNVDARLNGGSWTALSKTQWDWAKSLHAPNGTQVEFRATSSSGATVTSSAYTWT